MIPSVTKFTFRFRRKKKPVQARILSFSDWMTLHELIGDIKCYHLLKSPFQETKKKSSIGKRLKIFSTGWKQKHRKASVDPEASGKLLAY